MGAVIATCLVSTVQCIIALVLSKRYYPIPYEWVKVALMIGSAAILFTVIDMISVKGTSFGIYLDDHLSGPLRDIFTTLSLDKVKDGKLMRYVIDNIPLVFEAGIKFLLSFGFVLTLPLIGVLPADMYKRLRLVRVEAKE